MKRIMVAMAMAASIVVGGCGSSSAPVVGEAGPVVQTTVSTGKAVFRIPFSPEARAQVAMGKSVALPAEITVADIVAKKKTEVMYVNITPYSVEGDFDMPSQDYEIVNGWLIATMDVPAGSYRFSLSCGDAEGWEVFYGYSDTVTVITGQSSEATVTLELDSIPIDFVISAMSGSFDKSINGGYDGVVYKVDTTVANNLGYSWNDYDWNASIDGDGALHFSVSLSVYNDIPAKIWVSVKDNTGTPFSQQVNVDSQTLLAAIYNEQQIILAYEPTGTVNFAVSFKGE